MQSFDVIIAGGGMVGLALACGLQGSGLRVAVLEQRQPDMVPPSEQPALRVSAINAASERLLQHIGVWDDILQLRASATTMEVWERDSFGKIAFRGDECGFSHLGHIIENAVIQQALWKRAESLSDITLITPAALKQVAWGENDAFVTLEDGRMLTARLVIGADGASRGCASMPISRSLSGITATMRWLPPFAPKNRIRRRRGKFSTATAFWRSCRSAIRI